MTSLVAACLHAVATHLHLAPATRVTLAAVEKKPAAGLCLTGAQARHLGGEQEIARRERQYPDRQLDILFVPPPGPRQAGLLCAVLPPTQLAVPVCGMEVALDRLQVI